jgi:CHAT domain-containing protein
VWESFERRLEAEHYLGRDVRARALIDRLVGLPADTTEEAFRVELDRLTYADLRAFYNTVVELTGGPTGQAEGNADAERLQPYRSRLLALRASGSVALKEAAKVSADHLATQDIEFIRECKAIDEQFGTAFIAAYTGKATDNDADTLASAARGYELIGNCAPLSASGQRMLSLKVARALDGLARACDTNHRHAAAVIHFSTAALRYTEAGEEHLAAECTKHRDQAKQRQEPNADTRLEQLLAELDAARPLSVDRATALIDLATLAHGNHDDFEAENWLADAIAELASIGYSIPEPGGTDAAVKDWIEAIPPGDGEDPVYFLRRFAALLTLHTKVAGVRAGLALTRRGEENGTSGVPCAKEAELQLDRLAEIISELPARGEKVRARLAAQLGQSTAHGFGSEEASVRSHEFKAIMDSVNELRDLTAHSLPDGSETITLWRQMADDCIVRARAFGQPIPLALALDAAAQVELAADEIDAAMGLLEEEYRQVSGVADKPAANQAIMALTLMAKIQLGTLKDYKAALNSAVKAIELIERDRYRVSAPFQQAALLAPHADLFTAGVFAAWKGAPDGMPPGRSNYDLMLQLIELSKARASIRRLFLDASGDPGLDQQLGELNDKIHALDPVTLAADSAEDQEQRRAQARQAQQQLRRERLRLWDRRAIAAGDSAAPVPSVTVAGVQAVLEPDEAVISYYWLNSLVLLMVTITAGEIVVERKLLGRDQRTLLEQMISVLGSLTGANHGLDKAFIERLGPVLIPVDGLHLLEGKHRLIVSPHRLLHGYPFAALPYQGQPLVRSFALRYAPNLTSLLVPRAGPGVPRAAALAVSEFPGRPELGKLSGACRGAEDITAIYSGAGIPSKLMTEPTRGQVLAAMRDGALARAWCMHVDTHGHSLMDELSRNAPLESVLELADNSVDGYEIATADLGCEVVVLTACYSGQRAISGRGLAEQPGDELFGLSAAFLDARCNSVLAPTWPADDEAISPIITMFHRNLAKGAPADIALAQAQRAFLDTADFEKRPAYYWAPLVLIAIGRPRPMAANTNAPT